MPNNSTPSISDKPFAPVLRETLICISCHNKKSAKDPTIETSMELMEELDPAYQFRTMYDNYIVHSIYSKKHGLTKDAYINKIENDLLELNKKYTECILMIHKLTKIFPSNELPIAPIVKQIEMRNEHANATMTSNLPRWKSFSNCNNSFIFCRRKFQWMPPFDEKHRF